MRTAFFKTLEELAADDPRIFLVVGDLGFGVVESFASRFPRQYLNAGVAEQNMTGVAAGLALSGKIVFTYSIANFPTLRCLEQLRNDVCYHNADVKVVAVGGGYAYGALGMTHHATEDIAILRSLPQMTVVAPGDPVETSAAVRAIIANHGPCYLRLGRAGETNVHAAPIEFELGRAIKVREGHDATVISTGGMLATAVEVANNLCARGIHTQVLSMHTIAPLDADAIVHAAMETPAVFTLEEHSIVGGLGSAVAEVIAERSSGTIFKRFALPAAFSSKIGSQEYLRAENGLASAVIENEILAVLTKHGATKRTRVAGVSNLGGVSAV